MRPNPAIRLTSLVLGMIVVTSAFGQEQKKEHPLAPAIRLAQSSLKTLDAVKDYEAAFSKRELVNGKAVSHSISVKVRHEPFSVYMYFQAPAKGREVLYVAGRNNGNLLAHETGLKSIVGTVSLNPTGRQALAESRFPITNFGMKTMLELVVKQWEAESKFGECDVKYYPNAKLGTMQCKVIQSSHPTPRRQFKYHITRLYIDSATNLPVRVEQYLWPTAPGQQPVLDQQYTYSGVRVNVGLNDVAFDPRNPGYRF